MELFDRAAASSAQLLRVDRLAPAEDGNDADALLLTFDVGRILVSADPVAGRLVAAHLTDAANIPSGIENANEAEPWWRLLGSPLVHAAGSQDASQLRLEFQMVGARARTLTLIAVSARVRAAIETGD